MGKRSDFDIWFESQFGKCPVRNIEKHDNDYMDAEDRLALLKANDNELREWQLARTAALYAWQAAKVS